MHNQMNDTIILGTAGLGGVVGVLKDADWILIGTGVLIAVKIVHELIKMYKTVRSKKDASGDG